MKIKRIRKTVGNLTHATTEFEACNRDILIGVAITFFGLGGAVASMVIYFIRGG